MTKKAAFFSIPIDLDRSRLSPLWQQLYDSLRKRVLNGQLAPGTRLPPTRTLAKELGVGRNTVNNAYDQLIAEGYLEARQGAGTFVSEQLPETLLRVRAGRERKKQSFPPPETERPPRLSVYAEKLQTVHLIASIDEGVPVPFRPGIPALDIFPHALWRKMENDRWRTLTDDLLGYGSNAGYWPLREALAHYLSPARGVRCTPEQIIITAGTQQAIMLAGRLLLNPGDTVWVEEPGYVSARNVLAAIGAQLAPIAVDDEGIDVMAGELAAPGARLAYVTPSHQYPTGALMSLRRRLALLSWARRNEAWIIEDDYDSEYRYEGHPIASLQGLDDGERVIYVGSFSKVLFPSLRLGYLIAPRALVDVFTWARLANDHSSPLLSQAVTADFIVEGHFARHIRHMRTVYAERQAALLDASQSLLDDVLTVDAKPAGLHAVAWLAEGLKSAAVAKRLAAEGIETPPLSNYALGPLARQGLVLGYGAFAPAIIWQSVRKTAALLRKNV